MSRKNDEMPHIIRSARENGLTRAECAHIVNQSTRQAAAEHGWRPSELAMTLADYARTIEDVYGPMSSIEKLRAEVVSTRNVMRETLAQAKAGGVDRDGAERGIMMEVARQIAIWPLDKAETALREMRQAVDDVYGKAE